MMEPTQGYVLWPVRTEGGSVQQDSTCDGGTLPRLQCAGGCSVWAARLARPRKHIFLFIKFWLKWLKVRHRWTKLLVALPPWALENLTGSSILPSGTVLRCPRRCIPIIRIMFLHIVCVWKIRGAGNKTLSPYVKHSKIISANIGK